MNKITASWPALCAVAATAPALAQTDRWEPSADAVHERWASFEPRFQRHTCPRTDKKYDTSRVTCGYVLVPEDRTDADSRLIKLSVMKIAAAVDAQPELAIALLIPGGPGGPTIDFFVDVMVLDEQFPAFGERSDIIAFDERGVGYSEAELCRGITRPWLRGVPTFPDGEARFADDVRRCFREARDRGVAVDAYSTWHNALDVRDIRRALGYSQWNIWGGSYGTRLGQAVMQVDSGGTRSAILDAVMPAVFPEGGLPVGFRSSLDAIKEACANDRRCTADAGDLTGRLEATLSAYDAEPLILEDLDENIFEGGRFVLDGQILASIVFVTLYLRPAYGSLPSITKALEDRDSDGLAVYLTELSRGFGANQGFGIGMNFVTNCRSDLFEVSAATRVSERLSRWVIEPGLGDGAAQRCAAAYRADPDASTVALKSDIPTLLVAGAMDPATTPALARSILPGLTQATLLEVPFTGHGALPALNEYRPGCTDELIASFVADPRRRVEIPCADAIRPPDFLVRWRPTRQPERFLSSIRDGARPILPAVVTAGLVFAFLAFPLAAIGRRIDGRAFSPGARIRLLAWLGAALSLTAGGVAAAAIATTVREYLFSLPFGVVPWIGWAGWLAVAGVLTGVAAAAEHVRRRRETQAGIGTAVGVSLTALLSAAFFVFLVSIGAGPI
jgi:pimeloyl-ACP methyl ester carboxylesterase